MRFFAQRVHDVVGDRFAGVPLDRNDLVAHECGHAVTKFDELRVEVEVHV